MISHAGELEGDAMTASDDREFVALHKSLRRDLERLGGECAAAGVDRDPKAEIAELKAAIKMLRKKLAEHFAFEEQEDGGYMRIVTSARPTLKSKVDRLRADHNAILASLDDLLGQRKGAQSAAALRSAFVAAMRTLRRHEAKEMDLVQQAVLDDLGSGD